MMPNQVIPYLQVDVPNLFLSTLKCFFRHNEHLISLVSWHDVMFLSLLYLSPRWLALP